MQPFRLSGLMTKGEGPGSLRSITTRFMFRNLEQPWASSGIDPRSVTTSLQLMRCGRLGSAEVALSFIDPRTTGRIWYAGQWWNKYSGQWWNRDRLRISTSEL